ncbi:hypothetical protein AJ80_06578 [Polytolypa hystricis UAMH7299]|uniref:Probable 26S proteasome regulatory subunit p27 n=1 Tax=Polytolypa hystricis (strain UAMH7299) TaxID=1447883 RepID=A0A2B7XV72_POLH7|nr:hypothetical protein AJ80_06578 [Polytolypa hystricis UAMH7299]
MGIPMDDIHTPTVASGPTSTPARQSRATSSVSLHELFAEKDRLEAELKALGAVLESHGVHMSTSLTTFDGYPRDDIDVPQIRTTRARIIHLRNDYKNLMKKVEQGIHAHFASLESATNGQEGDFPRPFVQQDVPAELLEGAATTPSGLVETPFARVNSVAAGSPAAEAGMKVGDKVRSFGIVNWMNHENLRKIAEFVATRQDQPIPVKVLRKNEGGEGETELILLLTPRQNWGGRGSLGCHLVVL